MYIFLSIVATLCALSLGFVFWCQATAPRGYQDKNGFHKGEGQDDDKGN